MVTWILRDGAWRGWPLWVVLGALNTSLFMNLQLMNATRRGEVLPAASLLLVTWISLALYLLFGQTRARCGVFQLSLPVDARRIWLAHTAAVSIAAALMVAVMIGIGFTLARLLGRLEVLDFQPVSFLASGVAGAILAAVLLQVPSPRLARVPFSLRYASWFAASLAGVVLLAVACAPLGAAGALVPIALAAAVAAVAIRRVPRAFTLVPLEAETERVRAQAPAARRAAVVTGAKGVWRTRIQVAGAVFQSVSSGSKEWFGVPFIVLFGVVNGGGLSALDPDLEILRYLYVFMSAYLLFSMTGPRVCRLHHLDALPVSRRVMFALLVLPYVAAFVGGYGIGTLLQSRHARDAELVDYRPTRRGYALVVPANAYVLAWGEEGRAAAARARRGVRALPVWRGLDAVLYSPYDVPAGSSIEEVAKRISRAAEVVYDATIPPAEIAERYLETRPDGVVAPRGEGLTLRRDHPGLEPRDPGPLFPALLTAALLPWLLLTALLFRTYREGIPARVRYAVVFGPTGLLVVGGVGMALLLVSGYSGPWLIQAAFELPLLSMAGSGGTAIVWALCAALVGGAYLVAQRGFERMEIPVRPFRFTIVDQLRGEP